MMLLLWSWDPNYVWFARDTGRRREASDDCKRNKLICLSSSLWVWMNMLFTITLTPVCLTLSRTHTKKPDSHTHTNTLRRIQTYTYVQIDKKYTNTNAHISLSFTHTHKAYLSDFLFFYWSITIIRWHQLTNLSALHIIFSLRIVVDRKIFSSINYE